MTAPRLFLIDSFGYIFRAYHARARSGAPPMRTSTGLSTEAVYIFHNMLRKLLAEQKPEYLAAVFESVGPTFREQAFAEYKANRPEAPPELLEQIPWILKLLKAQSIPVLQFEGFEADDVIGTLARKAAAEGFQVVIVTADKDMMQLVDDRILMLNPAKDNAWYDVAAVQTYLGVSPAQVPDLLALRGDPVDNIPGAPGIGDKGARDLIARFGSVEAALDRAAEVERKTYRESLLNNRDQILLSKRLATIDTQVPISWDPRSCALREPDFTALRELYRQLEFFSLLKELEPQAAEPGAEFRQIADTGELRRFLAATQGRPLAIAIPAGAAEGALAPTPVGLSGRQGEGVAVTADLLGELRGLLEDAAWPKIVHNFKEVIKYLETRGISPSGFTEDVMLYGFLLSADPGGCSLEKLSERHLQRAPGAAMEQRAEACFALAQKLRPELERQGVWRVYEEIELPLAPVLARMERAGIRIETAQLARLAERMEAEIQRLTAEIHALAGRSFNINSPQQLSKVLFEELGLAPPSRYGRSKTVSTAADVLEEMAAEHPIAGKVLEYRQLTKLKNTYVDALPALIDASTGRLHTTFNQTGAATGRLSSSEPNLQNIPIRTELGREIRAAFVPREGWKLLTADYSQIELRLLAHMSEDKVLVEAFRNGEDIHTRTAAEVFGVPPLMVTPEMRRNAKAVNFGIVYGQTAFGLAQQLGIDRAEAESYIKSYFERYEGVKKFIDRTIAEVRRTGIVRTEFGRLRPIPDINSSNPNARGFAERTAVNTPLQGTAADLIKLAMIRIDADLRAGGFRSQMLLQVHDELVLECPPEELPEVAKLVKSRMEGVYRLKVPLVAETGSGDNWRDAK